MTDNVYLAYGECPTCGRSCQPDVVNLSDPSLEYAACCDCEVIWYIHHDDPTDPRNETEPWRVYRISDVETFEQFGAVPYECKGHRK